MKKTEKYFSIVTDRIQELRLRLANPTISALEREFIENKIEYLRKLTDLPLYYSITHMPADELKDIKERYGCCDKDFLVQLYGLEKIAKFMNHSTLVPLQDLKVSMLEDYDAMETLIELKAKREYHEAQKQKLWGVELDGSMSYLQLRHDEINLTTRERNVENAIKDAVSNYHPNVLSELREYQNDSDKPLSMEFILKHQSKVEKKPGMQKLIKSLTRPGLLGKLSKLSPFRKQKEREFVETVLDSYKKNNSLMALGIKNQDVTEMNDDQINLLINQIRKQANVRRKKIKEAKSNLKFAKELILKHVRNYEALEKQDKRDFMALLSTKTKHLPNMFQEQIWKEPNLKNELKKVSCYQEEKMLLEQLGKSHEAPVLHVTSSVEQEKTEVTAEQPKVYAKRVA